MVVHVEWLDAGYTSVEALPHGAAVGGHLVSRDAALLISADDAVAIQGTPGQLRQLLTDATNALDRLTDTLGLAATAHRPNHPSS